MRSSKRKLTYFIVAVIAVIAFFVLLDLAMYPCTFIRNDIHAVLTEDEDVVILGSSDGKMNIDPDVLLEGTGEKGHNLCVGGEYAADSYYLTKLMIEKNKPDRILYELNPSYYVIEKEPGNNYQLFYHEFPLSAAKLSYFTGTMLDCDPRTVFFQAYEYSLGYEIPRIPETLSRKLTGDYSIAPFKGTVQEYHANGHIEKYPAAVESFPAHDPLSFEVTDTVKANTSWLEKLIRLCQDNGIELTAVATPLCDDVVDKSAADYDRAWTYFGDLLKKYDVRFYNFNTEYYDAYPHSADIYVDYEGHMNGENAEKYSAVLREVLSEGGDLDG